MTNVFLLDALKIELEDAVKDVLLPVKLQEGDTAKTERAAEIHRMRLPNAEAAKKKAPYILIQLTNAEDNQPEGERVSADANVRFVFCVYGENEEDGAIQLLNLMDAVRIRLLKRVVIGGQFKLDLSAGLQMTIYYEDTAPYYFGEMTGKFSCPAVERDMFDGF